MTRQIIVHTTLRYQGTNIHAFVFGPPVFAQSTCDEYGLLFWMFSLGWVNFQISAACRKPKITPLPFTMPAAYLFWSLCTHFKILVESFSLQFLLCLAKFSCPFLLCETNYFLSLLLCLAHSSRSVFVGLANFFQLQLFFCPPTVVCKIDQRQTHHKKHDLCQVLHKSVKCLRGENIEEWCDQVQMECRWLWLTVQPTASFTSRQ